MIRPIETAFTLDSFYNTYIEPSTLVNLPYKGEEYDHEKRSPKFKLSEQINRCTIC
jgi:hypothetical protein